MEPIRNFPDQELVANIRSGQRMEEMIKAIYREHFGSLSWYVVNNSGSRQDAEDIFQEVIVSFIELVQKDKFRGESTVKTFLYSLNRYTWLNELKKRGSTQAREEKYESQQDRVQMDTSHLIADRESKAMIRQLVDRLGETCRKILALFYFENLSMKDILLTTDYENEQVLRNKKYKCIKQLSQVINENPSLKQTLKSMVHG